MDEFEVEIHNIIQAKMKRDEATAEQERQQQEAMDKRQAEQETRFRQGAYDPAVLIKESVEKAGGKSKVTDIVVSMGKFEFALYIGPDYITFTFPTNPRPGGWIDARNNTDYQGGASSLEAGNPKNTLEFLKGWATEVVTEQNR